MFVPDETHSKIMAAQETLNAARKALAEGVWAEGVLRMLLAAMVVGDVQTVLMLVKRNEKRINAMGEIFANGVDAVGFATGTLEFARSKIPNTTPPDPGGLESCSIDETAESMLPPYGEIMRANARPE